MDVQVDQSAGRDVLVADDRRRRFQITSAAPPGGAQMAIAREGWIDHLMRDLADEDFDSC